MTRSKEIIFSNDNELANFIDLKVMVFEEVNWKLYYKSELIFIGAIFYDWL